MATKFFLIETASDVNPSADIERKASLTAGDGSGLQTDVANTILGGSALVKMTDTAGGTNVFWLSAPLNTVDLSSSTQTMNFWMSESSMSANVQAAVDILICNNDGTERRSIYNGSVRTPGVELPVTTRAAQNYTGPSAVTNVVADGERIKIIVYGFAIGGMAAGFTFDLGYNGTTGAADGDSWVSFTQTITEQSVAASDAPFPYTGGGYYGFREYVERARKRFWRSGWERRPSGLVVPA